MDQISLNLGGRYRATIDANEFISAFRYFAPFRNAGGSNSSRVKTGRASYSMENEGDCLTNEPGEIPPETTTLDDISCPVMVKL